MNVLIFSDLEGVPEIYSIDELEYPSENYKLAMEKHTRWLNITADACFNEGADKVYFIDGHAGPTRCNIIYDILDERLIETSFDKWHNMVKSGEVDCIIEYGSHARAGTFGGFLDHTTNSRLIFSHKVGGREFSELALHAVYAGKYDVPTVLCIGDEAACNQAKEYIPEIATAAVKLAKERNTCSPIGNPEEIIRAGVKDAFRRLSEIKPMKTSFPCEVTLTLYRTDYLEDILKKYKGPYERRDARTLAKIIDNLDDYENLYFR